MLATLLHALLVSQALAWGGDARETGFEALPAGPFTEIATELGAFRATEGPALVGEGHARSGKRCLQLAGPRSVVELEFAEAPAAGRSILATAGSSKGAEDYRRLAVELADAIPQN